MVLQHVARSTRAIVIGAAILHTDGFQYADLHVIDMPVTPERLEQCVAKAQRQQVLHGLLAQKMINAEDPGFVEHTAYGVIDLAGGGQAFAQGFFQYDTGLVVGQPGRMQVQRSGRKQVRQRGQVEHPHATGAVTESLAQASELQALADVQDHVVQPLGKAAPASFIKIGLGNMLADVTAHQFAVALRIVLCTGQRQNPRVRVQMAVAVEIIQGGQ